MVTSHSRESRPVKACIVVYFCSRLVGLQEQEVRPRKQGKSDRLLAQKPFLRNGKFCAPDRSSLAGPAGGACEELREEKSLNTVGRMFSGAHSSLEPSRMVSVTKTGRV
ncbi:hypothetical protein SKAU_G00311320 [Synaphobranchus kaupii]|uniref:Uncharacterized protein n=1 Tax=Synaphobranchus kaupii TaxID=118154 RepID=A0A9Q1ERX1_SYNKA|nr:hypothetical protein SKAU_G00311320 [Synaphobranchus kaupii]